LEKKDKTLVVIAGPTAVGKTALSIKLAKEFGTEIISADSRQVYRELSIGTAKPTRQELQEVKHHFINSHSITQGYDAAQYGKDALETLETLFKEKQIVILCGGSGLYIKAVCEGFDDIPEISPEIRISLNGQYEKHGLLWLQEQMKLLDPNHFINMDQQNPQRLLRALEVRIGTGESISFFQKKEKKTSRDFNVLKIGLELPREQLYDRINIRMDQMISEGLFEEAKNLYPFRQMNALQTVGYREIFDHIEGQYDYQEAVRLLKRNTRWYAKRQLTWFKRDNEMRWFLPYNYENILAHVKDY
jgi:tRNA dimethylallyltransferase